MKNKEKNELSSTETIYNLKKIVNYLNIVIEKLKKGEEVYLEEIQENIDNVFKSEIMETEAFEVNKLTTGIERLNKSISDVVAEIAKVTKKQAQILDLLGQTPSLTEIGAILGISPKSVSNELSKLRAKKQTIPPYHY